MKRRGREEERKRGREEERKRGREEERKRGREEERKRGREEEEEAKENDSKCVVTIPWFYIMAGVCMKTDHEDDSDS
jgi:hypothetical protein